jgi:predicted PurR-regulated permease PerM
MAEAKEFGPGQRALLVFAALVVAVAGLQAARAIVVPVLLALFLAALVFPIERALMRRGMPRWAAVLVVVLGAVGVLAILSGIVGRSIADFRANLPAYETALRARIGEVVTLLDDWAEKVGVELPERDIKKAVDPALLMKWLRASAAAGGNLLSASLFVAVTLAFMLAEASTLPARLRQLASTGDDPLRDGRGLMDAMQGYLKVKTLVSLITGVLVAVAVWACGVDFPILWGLVAFGLNYVPNIGSILAAIPAVLLAYLQYGPGRMGVLALCYFAVNIVMWSVIEPRMMGRKLGLSTLVVFLSLVFWGWVLGPVGMVLSVPLTMALKVALDRSEDLRWVSAFLGAAPDEEPAAA